MSGEYRQKLLNWFCSVTLVLAFSALSPLLYWFINIPEWMEFSLSREFSEVAFFFGETFLIYALVLPVVLFSLLGFRPERRSRKALDTRVF